MNPYVVVLFEDGSGYCLNRDYGLMLEFANACNSWKQYVKEKCLKHETHVNWEGHATPMKFNNRVGTAHWMY